jgi:hypothetical protein
MQMSFVEKSRLRLSEKKIALNKSPSRIRELTFKVPVLGSPSIDDLNPSGVGTKNNFNFTSLKL